MFNSSFCKLIPLAAAISASLMFGGVALAQGTGSAGAGTSPVQNGASPMPGTAGAEAGPSAATKPTIVKKAKLKARKPKTTMQQPAATPNPADIKS